MTYAARLVVVLNSVPEARGDKEVRAKAIAALRVQLHDLTCSCVDMEVLLDSAAQRLGMSSQELAAATGISRMRRGNGFLPPPM